MDVVLHKTVMGCGHIANAERVDQETGQRRPCCVICAGWKAGAYEPMDPQPEPPKGYRCSGCRRVSDRPVAFADTAVDRDGYARHYDGCRGWD
jgi:hypothetical protein